MELVQRIAGGRGEFLLFAVTPPRAATPPERLREIAVATVERLRPLDPDGLILYDIDDESDRNSTERPFPFAPTVDPARYLTDQLADHLEDRRTPVIVYRAVSKHAPAELRRWFAAQDATNVMTVLVGGSSGDAQLRTSLSEAHELRRQVGPAILAGGVAIPERHTARGDEHLRLLAKQEVGCRFFVSQVVYDVNAAKNLVSDYHYACLERGTAPVPVVFTFSLCGSDKTLNFLQWLGVAVPRWIENDLRHSSDTLDASYEFAVSAAVELLEFCRALGVPVGLNVESVSIRRVEIEASVRLAQRLRREIRR